MADISLLAKHEQPYASNNYSGGQTYLDYMITSGKTSVMLCATRSTAYASAGKVVPAECYTGALAKLLYEQNGCSCITKTRYTDYDVYSESYARSKFKDSLAQYIEAHEIRYVIDLHVYDKDSYTVRMCNPSEENLFMLHLLDSLLLRAGKGTPTAHKHKRVLDPIPYDGITLCGGISANTEALCMELWLSKEYLNPVYISDCTYMLECLSHFVDILDCIKL